MSIPDLRFKYDYKDQSQKKKILKAVETTTDFLPIDKAQGFRLVFGEKLLSFSGHFRRSPLPP
jgi:hypothetical protein